MKFTNMSVCIKKSLLVTLSLLISGALFGQSEQEYLIHWAPQDTVVYQLYFGPLETDVNVTNDGLDIAEKDLKTFEDTLTLFVEALMEPILEELSQYPIEMVISRQDDEISSLMTFGGMPVAEAQLDEHGTLLTEVAEESVNLYRIFMSTPKSPVKVGDTWQPALESGISFTTMTLSDSSKFKQSVLSSVGTVQNTQVAVVSTLLKEMYKGKALDEDGQLVDQHFDITISSIMHWNLDRNILIEVNGMISYHNKLNDYKQADRYSMKLKQ